MSEADPRETLKSKYNLSDEALDEILKTGVEGGLVEVEPSPQKAPSSKEPREEDSSMPIEGPGADIIKALRSGGDLDEMMRFMLIDNWIKERFGGKGKVPSDVQEMLDKLKLGKKDDSDLLDKLIDKMMKYDMIEVFMENRRARRQPSQQQPPQPAVDVEKAIREIGDKMAAALHNHKLEDEKDKALDLAEQRKKEADAATKRLEDKERAEEEDKKLEARVKERVEPLQKELDQRMKTINERLTHIPAEERGKYVLDLNELVTETLGEEIKGLITDSLKGAFNKEESPPVTQTPDGKLQVDFFRLGERALKTLDNFISRLPTQAPPKSEVKKLPPLPPASSQAPAQAPQPPTPAQQPPAEKKGEKTIITEKTQKEVQTPTEQETTTPAPARESPESAKSSEQSTATNGSQKA